MLIVIAILAVLVIGVFAWIGMYNSLVKYSNWVEEAWAQIDVQLKRQYDLIPNLVETVKGYAKHESETLEKVIQARNSMLSGDHSRSETMTQSDSMNGALKGIFALSESYPAIRANENFLMLQEELQGTSSKIAYARQLYNTTTVKYNTKIQTVPTNIVAGIHGYKKQALLEAKEEERQNVKVSF